MAKINFYIKPNYVITESLLYCKNTANCTMIIKNVFKPEINGVMLPPDLVLLDLGPGVLSSR